MPRLYVQWPTVGEKHDDRLALDVLRIDPDRRADSAHHEGARLRRTGGGLSGGRQSTNEDVGEFLLTVTPRPGHSLTNLEAAADAIIERLKTEGPTAEEIQKAIAGEELSFVQSLESNLGKAIRLADGADTTGFGYFRTEYQKTLAVTAADVKRVAKDRFDPWPRRPERRSCRESRPGRQTGR